MIRTALLTFTVLVSGAVLIAPVTAQQPDLSQDFEEEIDPYAEEDFYDEDFDEFYMDDEDGNGVLEETDSNGVPTRLLNDENPLNPIGDTLEQLVHFQFSEDVWAAMMGDLPCLDMSGECLLQLQDMAIANNYTLGEIEWRIEEIQQRIDDARARNQQRITFGIFEPFVEDLIRIEQVQRTPDFDNPPEPGSIIVPEERGFLEKVLSIFVEPVRGLNDILSFIGIPLFRGVTGGGDAAQQRSIQIADLQIKLVQVQQSRDEMVQLLREQVVMELLAFDESRRQFQISQEIAKREYTRLQLLEVDYYFGNGDTQSYLRDLSGIDRQRAQTYTDWARLVTQLTKIKILVTGEGNF
jgi:hypothetical protein